MKPPMVPVYEYMMSSPTIHFIKIGRRIEEIDPVMHISTDFCIGCSIGRNDNLRKNVSIMCFCQQIVENLQPAYYISSAVASNILKQLKLDNSNPVWIGAPYIDIALKQSKSYAREFEEYALYRKQEKATRKIQKAFLENYYNPNTAFCQARLQRDLKRLQSA